MSNAIAVIDMKAFYAFIECIERGLNPFTTPLAVCDPNRGDGTIVLSVSPFLKNMGIPSRCRRRELPEIKGLILAQPRMQKYIEKSAEIISIVLDLVGEDDIHVYSIDEFFVNLTPYLKMYNCTPRKLVMKIQKAIFDKTQLMTTAGLSYNMLMAKIALDTDAKKRAPYISEWTQKDIERKLWKITPLHKMWGISNGYEQKLNSMGITTVGELAHTDKEFLKNQFGIMGEQLWEHANGIDNTNIREKYIPEDTSLSIGQVLFKDYTPKQAELILKEMCDDLCLRMRMQNKKTSCVSVSCGFTYTIGGGFSRQCKLDYSTDNNEVLLQDILRLFRKYVGDNLVRRLYISFGDLDDNPGDQLNLFEPIEEQIEKKSLQKVLDTLKIKYGKDIVLRASSLLEESTAKERHQQIGGHHK